MKVKYIIQSIGYTPFKFGAEYKVLANYRQSRQQIDDNGFVVIDDRGQIGRAHV